MLRFEVFIIHLSSSSKEGTCSVPLNYRILLCQLQWDRKECYGWLRETVRYTKFLGFIRTVLFQGRNTARLLFECIRDTFGVGVEILWFFSPSLPERCLKFDCFCLGEKKSLNPPLECGPSNVDWKCDICFSKQGVGNPTVQRWRRTRVLFVSLVSLDWNRILLGLDRRWWLDAVWSP